MGQFWGGFPLGTFGQAKGHNGKARDGHGHSALSLNEGEKPAGEAESDFLAMEGSWP